MSLRLEMLQVARLAPGVLGEAKDLVADFIRGSQNPDGGYRDREGKSDLYYTIFAIDGLTALQLPFPEDALAGYLESFGDGEGQDFVHLCCLARAWSALKTRPVAPDVLDRILARVEKHGKPEGGYEEAEGADHGSAYGCLLAYGAYADHRRDLPNPDGVRTCLEELRNLDGSWANDTWITVGNSPATAAAVTLSRNLRWPIPEETAGFLLSCLHPQGGFLPFPDAPLPDLLCTAVSLHALDGLQAPLGKIKEPCLDFIDTLWTNAGGFHGHWEDDEVDLEYTYYGLLALGHLAL